jgi:transcriptional regulator with XRE-family HTH domain
MKGRDEILLKKFGKNLQRIRVKKGLTLRKLAEECGIDHGKISKIENGKINVTFSTAAALAIGLGVNLAELIDFEE